MLAVALLYAVMLYAAIGAVVALGFVFVGLDRVDPSARGAYAFRPLIVPGCILLWPYVLMHWLKLERRAGS